MDPSEPNAQAQDTRFYYIDLPDPSLMNSISLLNSNVSNNAESSATGFGNECQLLNYVQPLYVIPVIQSTMDLGGVAFSEELNLQTVTPNNGQGCSFVATADQRVTNSAIPEEQGSFPLGHRFDNASGTDIVTSNHASGRRSDIISNNCRNLKLYQLDWKNPPATISPSRIKKAQQSRSYHEKRKRNAKLNEQYKNLLGDLIDSYDRIMAGEGFISLEGILNFNVLTEFNEKVKGLLPFIKDLKALSGEGTNKTKQKKGVI